MKSYIRSVIYAASVVIALAAYAYFSSADSSALAPIRLEEFYGFASLIYIYFALLPSPLYTVFPSFPFGPLYAKARRAIGVSAFCFALLHSAIAFFALLGGFQGLSFLSPTYELDLAAASVALVILFLLAATSFDYFLRTMGPWWKRLHRLVYIAGLLIIFHVVLIGAHFVHLDAPVPIIVFLAVLFLLVLEVLRIVDYH